MQVRDVRGRLVEKLRPLVESAQLRQELGERGREYVATVHDMSRVGDRLVEIYESL